MNDLTEMTIIQREYSYFKITEKQLLVFAVLIIVSLGLFSVNAYIRQSISYNAKLIEQIKTGSDETERKIKLLESKWNTMTSMPVLREKAIKLGFKNPGKNEYFVITE